jgi:AraC-like DNA-binding protein
MRTGNWNNSSIAGKNSTPMMPIRRLQWPVRARSNVLLAGLFPLEAHGFDHVYRSPVHAIHLHEYAGTIRLGGEAHGLEPGTFTLSPANEDSSYDLPRPGVHWCIHFEPQPMKGDSPSLLLPLVLRLGATQTEAVNRFSHIARLRELIGSSGGNDPTLRETASIALQELLLWIGVFERMDAHRNVRASDLIIEQLFDFIDRNLSRRFTAAELAAHAGLSQNHLARRFRQRAGTTLPSYVLSRRIGLARLLLRSTNLPIKQIAQRVGMPDPHHFNKQFRAIAGVSPSDFRNNDNRFESADASKLS